MNEWMDGWMDGGIGGPIDDQRPKHWCTETVPQMPLSIQRQGEASEEGGHSRTDGRTYPDAVGGSAEKPSLLRERVRSRQRRRELRNGESRICQAAEQDKESSRARQLGGPLLLSRLHNEGARTLPA